MTTTHPCPPPSLGWYAGRDEEIMNVGPFDTRQDAIEEALAEGYFQEVEPEGEHGWRAQICVMQGSARHINLSNWFDAQDWLYVVQDRMDDQNGGDESGENHPLEELTDEDIQALEASVRSAIWHWQHRRQIKLKAWYLNCKFDEFVSVPHPSGEDQS